MGKHGETGRDKAELKPVSEYRTLHTSCPKLCRAPSAVAQRAGQDQMKDIGESSTMLFRYIGWATFLALGPAVAILLGSGEALAQDYPSKTVRIVVPSNPGGGSDLVARTLAAPLAEMLGRPVIVENRVTSGGIVGAQQVAQSAPDGHTLLVAFDTFAINPFLYKALLWDPVRDFAPIMQVCRYLQVLLVHLSVGVKTVKEFIALAKQKGGNLNFGSAGPGSSSRLVYELF